LRGVPPAGENNQTEFNLQTRKTQYRRISYFLISFIISAACCFWQQAAFFNGAEKLFLFPYLRPLNILYPSKNPKN
ncbi:hypothetical protein ED312_16300, partial [Sinomicrobium pectinilyticum]